SDGSATYFSNAGSLTQVAGAVGNSVIQAAFTETASGTTSLQGGALDFSGGGTVSGAMAGAAGTVLYIGGPSFTFSGSSSVTGAGIVAFQAQVVSEAGAYDVSRETDVAGATTFTTPITDLGSHVQVGGVLNLPGQSFSLTSLYVGGTLNGAGGTDLTVTGSMTWAGGTVTGFNSLAIGSQATLDLGDASVNANETLQGVVLQNAGAASFWGGNFGSYGLYLQDGAGIDNQPGGSFTILNNATIYSDGSATYFSNAGSLTQVAGAVGNSVIQAAFTETASGTTSLQGGTLSLLSTAANSGTVTVSSGTTLSVGSYTQSAGTTVLNGGSINGGPLSIDGGALSGTGTINASVISGGQVVPGGTGAAGLLTINGTYTQTATGSLNIELGGTSAGSQYDQLAVSGKASLGGTLSVATINNFQPVLGNAFQVLTFASAAGNFGFYNGIVLGNRLILDPALNPNNLTLTVQPAVTTTTLSAPPSPSVSGQSVTFTATVTVALPPTTIDPTPTGTVTFYNNGTSIGTGTLSVVNGQEQASFTTSTLSTASHTITAAYTSGDGNFVPSSPSAAVTHVVNKASTSATVATSLSPSVYGQAVTFTATVSVVGPGSTAVASPTGTVTFCDNGQSIGTGTLSIVNGLDQASFTTSTLGTATHTITAAYTSGDGNFSASPVSMGLTQVVNKDSTMTSVSATPSFANVGQTVTFTAVVAAYSPGSGTPTGSVDFFDTTTNTDLTPGGVALSSGTATFSTTSLAVGSHIIKVTYSGDTNFLTSSASTGSITIGQSVIVLDPSAGGALSLSGNASINLTGGVYVDSNSSTALSASGNAQVKASVIDVHGGVQKSGNASFSPAPVTGAAPVPDPLASLAPPSTSGLTNYGSESLSGNSSATIKPGIYTQISVSGNGTLTLSSGIYIIEGGGFTVSGNASVSGSGVMIVNAGSAYPSTGGSYGSITLSGNGSYSLSPPATGTNAGIVIFQTRDNSKVMTISGNASGMTGTIYAPAAQLAESGNAALNAAVIVDTMTVSGNGIANTLTLAAPSGTVAYTPAQIRAAYGISKLSLDGIGQTIAIVDAYDDPSIFQSLDAFDSQFGLTTSGPTLYNQYGPASSFLTVLNQYGQATSLPSTDPSGPGTDNWELEEALDVEWAHAIAPGPRSSWLKPTASRFRISWPAWPRPPVSPVCRWCR
ncbi:MAG TPA: Ig-like domain repeat protein, partial [Isosphaeraceae bacterium]|nr:Ig-like domain repeat protein [Isosphaeraceae bacterium]